MQASLDTQCRERQLGWSARLWRCLFKSLRGKQKMKCKVCEEREGEASVLNQQGNVVLVCFECADRWQDARRQ